MTPALTLVSRDFFQVFYTVVTTKVLFGNSIRAKQKSFLFRLLAGGLKYLI